jgi:hypothetical protein
MSYEPVSRFQPTPILRSRRRRTLQRVQLQDSADRPLPVMMQNVSARGMRGICREGAVAKDEIVRLNLPDGTFLWGVVRWVEGRSFGVEFDTSVGSFDSEPDRGTSLTASLKLPAP